MSSKNIALISICKQLRYDFVFELGIAQLVGFLRDSGYSVKMFFYHNDETADEIAKITNENFDYYAFSVYETNAKMIYRVAERIKDTNPNSYIVCGGQFSTIYYLEIFNECNAIDYIILGDGEIPFNYLLEGNSIESYPYIASRLDEKNDYKIFVNDDVNWKPAEDYYHIRHGKWCVHNLLSKNNVCSGFCTFCCRQMSSKKAIFKPIECILDEIIHIHNKYNITAFYFVDDDLFDPNDNIAKTRIMELCEQLIKLNLGVFFYFYTKVTAFNDTVEDNMMLDKLFLAGFVNVYLGLESGNNDDLKLYNKQHNVNDNYKAIELFTRHHFNITIGFININPWSTLENLKENYVFLKNIEALEIKLYICRFLSIYKNSPLYSLLERDGLFGDEYDYLNTTKYQYKDKKIIPIIQFLNEYFLHEDSLSLYTEGYTWPRFMSYYKKAIRINRDLLSFGDEVDLLKNEYLNILDNYFNIIYIENDIEKAKRDYEKFRDLFLANDHKKNELVAKISNSHL